MLTNNYNIKSLAHDDIIKVLAEQHNITLAESAEVIKQLSFKEYMQLLEASVDRANIPSPSGNAPIGTSSGTITPAGPTANAVAPTTAPVAAPTAAAKTTYNPGDKVSVPNATGGADTSTVVSQNTAAGTITTRNAQTGKDQTHNLADLLPAVAGAKPTVPGTKSPVPGTKPVSAQQGMNNPFPKTLGAVKSLMQSASYEDKELTRILELAGITEDASCGSTSAGSIATVAQPMGPMHKRKQAEESGTGSIYGKISPTAATDELSRRLADAGKKTASRKNNGKKMK